MGYRDYSSAKGHIVDTTGHGDFSTIAAALTAAVAGQTIFVRPGTYTENLTLKAGVNICAFDCDSGSTRTNSSAFPGHVKIIGKITATDFNSGTVTCVLSGLYLQTNADFAVSITGTLQTKVCLKRCTLIGADNTVLSNTNSSGFLQVENCFGNLETTGIAYFTTSSNIDFYYCIFQNSGGSTTASTNSAGNVFISFCSWQQSITFSAGVSCLYTTFTGTLTFNSGTPRLISCRIFSGSDSAISIATGVTLTVSYCHLDSSNTNVITGLGTLSYSGIEFTGSSNLTNATGQTRLVAYTAAFNTISPAGDYTVVGTDDTVFADTSAARAITLPASPSAGQRHTIKDRSGTAGTNNITLSGNGHNIDGAATLVMNVNYQSITVTYSGTVWMVT